MLGYAALHWAPAPWYSYIVSSIASLAFFVYPPLTSILSKHLTVEQQGLGLGVFSAMKCLTSACGPYIFGTMYSQLNHKGLGFTPFLFGAVFSSLSFPVLFWGLKRHLTRNRQTNASISCLVPAGSPVLEEDNLYAYN